MKKDQVGTPHTIAKRQLTPFSPPKPYPQKNVIESNKHEWKKCTKDLVNQCKPQLTQIKQIIDFLHRIMSIFLAQKISAKSISSQNQKSV